MKTGISAVVAAAFLLLVGCSQTLDIAKAEEEIQAGIEEQTGASVTSVDCPDDVPLEEGNSFTCDVQGDDGSTGTVDVTQTDDEGTVRWELR